MKKIIAFAGSSSRTSMNKQLAAYAGGLLEHHQLEVLDLNDYELPMYSIDLENEKGIPKNAQLFLDKLHGADGIILSLAEHNGAYAAVFKNLFDWMSRINGKLWNDVPMLLMAASPGGRGGATVLEVAKGRFPYMGGNITSSFSLPNFYDNFKDGVLVNETLFSDLKEALAKFEQKIA